MPARRDAPAAGADGAAPPPLKKAKSAKSSRAMRKQRYEEVFGGAAGWSQVSVGDELLLGAAEGGFCGLEVRAGRGITRQHVTTSAAGSYNAGHAPFRGAGRLGSGGDAHAARRCAARRGAVNFFKTQAHRRTIQRGHTCTTGVG